VSGDSGSSLDAAPGAATRAERAARQADLFARARGGDTGAFDALFRDFNPLLWHVVRAQGLGSKEAADVVQTTWLELVQRLPDIGSPQALTGWLVTTARRQAWHARSRLRSRAPHSAGTTADVSDAAEPPDLLEVSERQRVLGRHVQRLADRCRELLRIVAFVDRPDYDVVAEALAMPRGSVGPTRGRCLAKLRASLAADPAWEMP
jgi:RNA polymerase sigma factor (sigma-70 family)